MEGLYITLIFISQDFLKQAERRCADCVRVSPRSGLLLRHLLLRTRDLIHLLCDLESKPILIEIEVRFAGQVSELCIAAGVPEFFHFGVKQAHGFV
jgi:hypothetical protein